MSACSLAAAVGTIEHPCVAVTTTREVPAAAGLPDRARMSASPGIRSSTGHTLQLRYTVPVTALQHASLLSVLS